MRRSGFTLVELLVVIVIIAVLVALLTPAVYSAVLSARQAASRVEISGLDAAMIAFRARYGSFPPSSLTISESPGGWAVADQAKIRGMWPQFDFTRARDVNSNGVMTDTLTLDASECLVFFLSSTSANVTDPFQSGGNRVGPFFELDKGRLRDPDGDGFMSYYDALNTTGDPIVYYSAYDGSGYVQTEVYPPMSTQYTQWRASSFQIVSPGRDGKLGVGGVYSSADPQGSIGVARSDEWDNITDFTQSRLVP